MFVRCNPSRSRRPSASAAITWWPATRRVRHGDIVAPPVRIHLIFTFRGDRISQVEDFRDTDTAARFLERDREGGESRRRQRRAFARRLRAATDSSRRSRRSSRGGSSGPRQVGHFQLVRTLADQPAAETAAAPRAEERLGDAEQPLRRADWLDRPVPLTAFSRWAAVVVSRIAIRPIASGLVCGPLAWTSRCRSAGSPPRPRSAAPGVDAPFGIEIVSTVFPVMSSGGSRRRHQVPRGSPPAAH